MGAPQKTASRARTATATTEQRIAHIMGLMRTLKFRTGETAEQLSREWGLGIRRMWELTAEASKRVRAEVMNPDAVSAHVGVALMSTLTDELAKGRKKNPRAIADLARTWADISGASAPEKHEIVGSVTPAQARARMADAFKAPTMTDAQAPDAAPDVSGTPEGSTE